MWLRDGLAKVIKANAKLFIVTFSAADVLFYIEYFRPITFFARDNESH